MSDINAQQFTTRNSVSLITLSGAHRSGNILDKFIDLLIGNKQVSFNYEFPFRYFRRFRKLNGRDKKDTRRASNPFVDHLLSPSEFKRIECYFYPFFERLTTYRLVPLASLETRHVSTIIYDSLPPSYFRGE